MRPETRDRSPASDAVLYAVGALVHGRDDDPERDLVASFGRKLWHRWRSTFAPGQRSEMNRSDTSESWRETTDSAPSSDAELIREGELVRLRAHTVANRPAFQRWYADEEIARLLRHDQQPLNSIQSRGYFDTIIMPLSARGMCFAIHEASTDRLIGTTAITDVKGVDFRSALFRIVIGEKDCWGRGYGTEATRLVVDEAFDGLGMDQVRLEVFAHNTRARAAYQRVGFRETGNHVEFVGRQRFELHVIEMALDRDDYDAQRYAVQESGLPDSITPADPEGG